MLAVVTLMIMNDDSEVDSDKEVKYNEDHEAVGVIMIKKRY